MEFHGSYNYDKIKIGADFSMSNASSHPSGDNESEENSISCVFDKKEE